MFSYKGTTALITGASSGIGAAIAVKLAERGSNLILSARNVAKLETIAEPLRQRYGVNVAVVAADLARADGADALCLGKGYGQVLSTIDRRSISVIVLTLPRNCLSPTEAFARS